MRAIPLHFLTLYADLAQSFEYEDAEIGSVSRRKIKGKDYLYLTRKDGGTRRQRSLGPAADPAVQASAKAIAEATQRAKARRTIVSTLKQKARIPSPTLPVGRVLEAVANAGLFKRGVTLVGTAAYQTYPCVIGAYLPSSAFTTNDVDLSVVEFEPAERQENIHAVLRRANASFEPLRQAGDSLPKAFRAADGLRVDMLTRLGRGATTVPIASLGCAAVALSFQEFATEDVVETVALYGSGVLVRVPTPLKFALHKLIVAQRRKEVAKRAKDLRQAKDLLEILLETDRSAVQEALDEARGRGKAWEAALNASLRAIGRDERLRLLSAKRAS